MTTVFGFAQAVSRVYGHGDSGSEQHICPMGSYGTGDFPPFFTTRQLAADYRRDHAVIAGMTIVPLKLYDTSTI